MKNKAVAIQLECRLNDISDLMTAAKVTTKMVREGTKIGFVDGAKGSGFHFRTVTPEKYRANGFD